MPIIFLLFVVLLGFYSFYRMYRPFGGRSARGAWLASRNFRDNIFVNQIHTSMEMSGRTMAGLLREQMRRGTGRQPSQPVRPEDIDMPAFLAGTTPQLIWLGHSSVLLRVDGKTLLTDPILSKRSPPFSFIGPKRTISDVPLTADELPPLDAVLISHDHYDHLDYETIRKIRSKTKMFFVPLGVAAHLRKWGVNDNQITELDWWDMAEIDSIKLACTPSRHFSGRRLGDRFKTLWCSWVIQAPNTNIFFSGDTGYGPHFKKVGSKYGPFDLTLLECGQYDDRWASIHMTPEQTFQACQDLGGKRLLPIHWGAFVLALHPWADPVRRVQRASSGTGTKLVSARIGEVLPVKSSEVQDNFWWNERPSVKSK